MNALKAARVALQITSTTLLTVGITTGNGDLSFVGFVYFILAFFAALMEDEEASEE